MVEPLVVPSVFVLQLHHHYLHMISNMFSNMLVMHLGFSISQNRQIQTVFTVSSVRYGIGYISFDGQGWKSKLVDFGTCEMPYYDIRKYECLHPNKHHVRNILSIKTLPTVEYSLVLVLTFVLGLLLVLLLVNEAKF